MRQHKDSIEWYKSLGVNQRINLKECFVLLCGVEWSDLAVLLDMRTRIDVTFNKLKIEGFEI